MSMKIHELRPREYPRVLRLLDREKLFAYLPDAFTPLWTVTPDGVPKALWGIEVAGEWVGAAGYVLVETKRTLAHLAIVIEPAFRHQGTGGQVLDALLDALQKRNVQHVLTMAYDQQAEGRRFLAKNGFRAHGASCHSQLDVAALKTDEWLDPDRLVAEQGLHFSTLNQFPRRGLAERLLPIWNRTRPDQPQEWPYVPYSVRRFEQEMLEADEMALEHSYAILTADGRIVALNLNSTLKEPKSAVRSSRLLTVYSAVDPDFRRRKLATALKVKLIGHVQTRGFDFLATENDERNVAMWRINQELGYGRLAELIRYKKVCLSSPFPP